MMKAYGNKDVPKEFFRKRAPSIFRAAQFSQVGVLETLCARGSAVNARDESGRTPLHYAATAAHPLAICLLLKAGADINAKDRNGNTPLHLVAIKGDLATARLLFAAGACVYQRNHLRIAPLSCAFQYNHRPLLELFLQHDIPFKALTEMSPLHPLPSCSSALNNDHYLSTINSNGLNRDDVEPVNLRLASVSPIYSSSSQNSDSDNSLGLSSSLESSSVGSVESSTSSNSGSEYLIKKRRLMTDTSQYYSSLNEGRFVLPNHSLSVSDDSCGEKI